MSENILRLPTLPRTMRFGAWVAEVSKAMPDGVPPRATQAGTLIGVWAAEPDAWSYSAAIDLAARQWALRSAFEAFADCVRIVKREPRPPLPLPC